MSYYCYRPRTIDDELKDFFDDIRGADREFNRAKELILEINTSEHYRYEYIINRLEDFDDRLNKAKSTFRRLRRLGLEREYLAELKTELNTRRMIYKFLEPKIKTAQKQSYFKNFAETNNVQIRALQSCVRQINPENINSKNFQVHGIEYGTSEEKAMANLGKSMFKSVMNRIQYAFALNQKGK
jgi:hypothetical protein